MVLKKLKSEITALTAKIEYNSKAGFQDVRKKNDLSEIEINKLIEGRQED